jgi:hypothetical protein
LATWGCYFRSHVSSVRTKWKTTLLSFFIKINFRILTKVITHYVQSYKKKMIDDYLSQIYHDLVQVFFESYLPSSHHWF